MIVKKYHNKNILFATIIGLFTIFLFYLFKDIYIDDAYISFTYIQNYLTGNGWVFNKGEYVEGLTNIGWAFFLTPFCMLFSIPFAAKLVSPLLFLLSLFLLFKIARAHFFQEYLFLLVILGPLFSFTYVYFSFSGMETSLISALFLIVLYLLDRNHGYFAVFIMTIACLVRPEVVIVTPIYLVLSCRSSKFRETLGKLLIFVLLLGLICVMRYSYFNSLLPNTFIAKYSTVSDCISRASSFILDMSSMKNIDTFFANYFAIALIFAGWLYTKTTKISDMGIAIIICGYAFSIYAKPDWTCTARYFAPYIPVAFLFLLIGFQSVISKVVARKYARPIVLGLGLTIVFTGCIDYHNWLQKFNENEYPMYVMNMQKLVPAAKWISMNTPETSIIASRRIGCLSFYSNRYVFDYRFGLTDKRVAYLVRENQDLLNPNDNLLKNLWIKIKPDYFLEDSSVISKVKKYSSGKGIDIHGFHYIEYDRFQINKHRYWVLMKRI